ncbi:MAG: efflux RND transporter periplasmic adaptor subunit [Isosphaeraceae bacterium]
MSVALVGRSGLRSRVLRVFPWLAMILSLALLSVYVATDILGRRRNAEVAATVQQSAPQSKAAVAGQVAAQAANRATTVVLSESKFAASKITTAPARFDELPTELGVPGKIDVNADRQIDIRAPAAGVIREVHVVLGQAVKRGDRLVTIDSPDVGTARLNLRARQRELFTARVEADWKSQVAATVALLIPEIRKGTDPSVIGKEFADKPLGAYRGSLLQAYAEFDIAAHEEAKTAGLRSQEVIGEHPAVVARHTREGLEAKLYAAIETDAFDAAQEKRLADQRVRRAESDVIDAAQRLRILGVSENIRDLLEHCDRANTLAVDEDVTMYFISAPFDGTVLRRDAVPSQKADSSDVLFTVADLNTVWVTANIGESDVASVPRIRGGSIRMTSTSYGARIFPAKLLSIGALVDAQTRTVPLMAETDNRDGLLKPGMFVRILLDSPTSERVLTVPHSGVVEIEGKSGVFVPQKPSAAGAADHHAFTFRPITMGRETGDRVVVESGLKEGDVVVASGAYLLKSELILQNQTEED